MTTCRRDRGFTLIEAAVTIAVIGIIAALAFSSFARQKPRASLATTAAELQSLLHGARQMALSTGHDVVVMFFPDQATGTSVGRVILYEDGDFDFFTGGAVNFATYSPTAGRSGARSQILDTMDLPFGVTIGPATGMGPGATLPAPYASIQVSTACSFCAASGDHRGAVRFDSRGRASFYQGGTPLTGIAGASITLQAAGVGGQRTLVISSSTGAVRALSNG